MKNILQQQLGVGVKLANRNGNFSPLAANATNTLTLNAMKTATRLIAHFFTPIRALASKPVFTLVPSNERKGKVIINLFYFIANQNQALSNSTINSLGEVLSKLFQRPVELRLVRVHYPYMNSYILAQYVAINTNRYNFTRIQRAIFAALQVVNQRTLFLPPGGGKGDATDSATALPAYITGVKIRISGRLTTQRSVPRQTVQTAQIGAFSDPIGGKEKNVIESASFTSKNKKGAFTVKVWISQLPLTP